MCLREAVSFEGPAFNAYTLDDLSRYSSEIFNESCSNLSDGSLSDLSSSGDSLCESHSDIYGVRYLNNGSRKSIIGGNFDNSCLNERKSYSDGVISVDSNEQGYVNVDTVNKSRKTFNYIESDMYIDDSNRILEEKALPKMVNVPRNLLPGQIYCNRRSSVLLVGCKEGIIGFKHVKVFKKKVMSPSQFYCGYLSKSKVSELFFQYIKPED